MRRIAFWLSLALIFIVPWEDSVTIDAVGSVARLVGLVVAGFWLLTILTEGRFRKPQLFHVFVYLFFLWNLVSMFWTLDLDRTILRIKTWSQVLLLILILWELYQKPSDLIAGLQAYVFGAWISIASTIINYIKGTTSARYEVRFSATEVNAVDLSLILLLGLPVAWYLFAFASKGNKSQILRLINLFYLPFSIFSIILTASRSALFAIVPAGIYILWSQRTSISRRILLFLVLVVSIVVLPHYIPLSVMDRLGTVGTSLRAADLGGRVGLWRKTIAVFLEHPLLGGGSGVLFTTIGAESHNTFLSVIAETGLIGFILFLSILAIAFYQAARLSQGHSGLWLAVLMVWAIGVFGLTWEFRKPTWIFLSFVVIQGNLIPEKLLPKRTALGFSAEVTRRSLNPVDGIPSLGGLRDRL